MKRKKNTELDKNNNDFIHKYHVLAQQIIHSQFVNRRKLSLISILYFLIHVVFFFLLYSAFIHRKSLNKTTIYWFRSVADTAHKGERMHTLLCFVRWKYYLIRTTNWPWTCQRCCNCCYMYCFVIYIDLCFMQTLLFHFLSFVNRSLVFLRLSFVSSQPFTFLFK